MRAQLRERWAEIVMIGLAQTGLGAVATWAFQQFVKNQNAKDGAIIGFWFLALILGFATLISSRWSSLPRHNAKAAVPPTEVSAKVPSAPVPADPIGSPAPAPSPVSVAEEVTLTAKITTLDGIPAVMFKDNLPGNIVAPVRIRPYAPSILEVTVHSTLRHSIRDAQLEVLSVKGKGDHEFRFLATVIPVPSGFPDDRRLELFTPPADKVDVSVTDILPGRPWSQMWVISDSSHHEAELSWFIKQGEKEIGSGYIPFHAFERKRI